MPLKRSASKSARQANTKTEIDTLIARGIPKAKAIKQGVAIGYSVQRQASKRKAPKSKGLINQASR